MSSLKVRRLCLLEYAGSAFSGDGAFLFGGRWNPPGVSMVYAATSLSLAALEMLVHMPVRELPKDYVWIEADLRVEESKVERWPVSSLPRDWRSLENAELQAKGAAWSSAAKALAVLVPSVVIPEEWNVLINPLHSAAKNIVVGAPKPFVFDERLFK